MSLDNDRVLDLESQTRDELGRIPERTADPAEARIVRHDLPHDPRQRAVERRELYCNAFPAEA
ncbi:MAG: hypothetical protein KY476_00395 [Planctomycetes bacterium]|nr:hypothetical protein [Planctomycetota bacterium]